MPSERVFLILLQRPRILAAAMTAALASTFTFSPQNPSNKNTLSGIPGFSLNFAYSNRFPSRVSLLLNQQKSPRKRLGSVSGKRLSSSLLQTRNYEFSDGVTEIELRFGLGAIDIESSRDVFVDVNESSLAVRVRASGSLITLLQTNHLYEKIKPSETIWYIDEDQLVVNLKKHDTDLKWPDVMESWESLTNGVPHLLKGTSIYIIGDSTEINQKVAKELATGIGYTPLSTRELLEKCGQQSIDSWMIAEGADSIAEAEGSVIESLSSHVRAVVATLGGKHGAAGRAVKWQHLYAGFTVWLSQSEAADEASAKEEAQRSIQDGSLAYSKADVIVKLGGWESEHARPVAQGCLSALKQLIISDKKLTGKKSLYIRLGCRGDWPNIKPPGWNPSSGEDLSPEA